MDRDDKWKLLAALGIFGAVGLGCGLMALNTAVFYAPVSARVTRVDSGQCELWIQGRPNMLKTRPMPCDTARALQTTDRYHDYYLLRRAVLSYTYTAPSDGRAYTAVGRELFVAENRQSIPVVGQALSTRVNKTNPLDSQIDLGE